jgi:hypothetical protein
MKRLLALAFVLTSTPALADDDNPFAGFVGVTPSATSQLDAGHAAGAALDAGWCAKKGTGVGESLTLTLSAPTALGGLDVTARPVKKANAITQLTVALDGGAATTIAVDKKGRAHVAIGKPVTSIQIGIAAAKKGKKGASCLTASLDGGPFLVVSDPKAAAAFATDGPKIEAALTQCDATTLADAVAFPFVDTSRTEGEHDETSTTYKDAAQMVADHCQLSLQDPDCSADGLDSATCEPPETGGDHVYWTFAWKDGHWKAASVDRTAGTGE